MATTADQRLLDLLDKWRKSLELHAKYSSLDDDSYRKAQSWVEHQRPSRWIIDVALQKTLELRTHFEERLQAGDAKFAESLELMAFLANLVGSEHIERFIPLADVDQERAREQASQEDTARTASDALTGTREMPKFVAPARDAPPAGTALVARSERKTPSPAKPGVRPAAKQPAKQTAATKPAPASKPPGKPASRSSSAAPSEPGNLSERGGSTERDGSTERGTPSERGGSSERAGPSEQAREQVIADAARLVQWGRKWYELPELIARMADRPSLAEVRRILRENKSAIDAKAGGK
jgi:hypothetical protein